MFGNSLAAPGFFRRSGALWVGINASPELFDLQKELSAGLGVKETRAFHPHITLGRMKQGKIFQGLENIRVEPVRFGIASLYLMRSELLPSGARHTRIGCAVLRSQ